ncbi:MULTISPECIES: Fic family protein [unclassified Campylobacter]|uniref:Fic family protein n=1 Tax=unclassified Campylobacter TaxID=2593542 RepID=UPI001CC1E684|nr:MULTISPECIES: winged helix-turn-helix transcriptional regulator [unclassified Campylobacter]
MKSSIFHYEVEFIHPFDDGNGRMGRMWQSKLLGEYNGLFYYLSIEELIARKQKDYYKVLSKSDKNGNNVEFVEFMLKIIKLALDELVNGTINDTLNGVLNENEKAILRALKKNPKLTQKELSIKFNLSLRTINRILKNLNEKAYLKRMGSKKSGYYEVLWDE